MICVARKTKTDPAPPSTAFFSKSRRGTLPVCVQSNQTKKWQQIYMAKEKYNLLNYLRIPVVQISGFISRDSFKKRIFIVNKIEFRNYRDLLEYAHKLLPAWCDRYDGPERQAEFLLKKCNEIFSIADQEQLAHF